MEKKVLLKKLVDGGTHIRREFIPTAIVSDYGTRPIGEFWDANKTIDVIVNGAEIAHDTIREVDELAHTIERNLAAEVTRAKAAEKAIQDALDEEIARAVAAEGNLQDSIDTEETRATAAEQALDDAKQDKITSTNKLDYSFLSNTPDIASLIARIEALEQAIINQN